MTSNHSTNTKTISKDDWNTKHYVHYPASNNHTRLKSNHYHHKPTTTTTYHTSRLQSNNNNAAKIIADIKHHDIIESDTNKTTNDSIAQQNTMPKQLSGLNYDCRLKAADRLNIIHDPRHHIYSLQTLPENNFKQLKFNLNNRGQQQKNILKSRRRLNKHISTSDQKPSKFSVKLLVKPKGKRDRQESNVTPNHHHLLPTILDTIQQQQQQQTKQQQQQPYKFETSIFSLRDILKWPLIFQPTWLTTKKPTGEIILKFLSFPQKVSSVVLSPKEKGIALADAKSPVMVLEAEQQQQSQQTQQQTVPIANESKETNPPNYAFSSSSDSGGSNSNSSGDDSDSLKSGEDSDESISNVLSDECDEGDEDSSDETNITGGGPLIDAPPSPSKKLNDDNYHRMVIPSPLTFVNRVIGLLASQAAKPISRDGGDDVTNNKQNTSNSSGGSHDESSSTDGRDSSNSNSSGTSSSNSPSNPDNISSNGSESSDEESVNSEELNNSVNNKFSKIEIIDGTKNVKYGTAYWVQRNVITVQVLASFVFDECKILCYKDHTNDVKVMETLSFVEHFSRQHSATRENVNSNAMFEASFKKKLPFTSGRPETQKFIWLTSEFYLKGKLIHKSSTSKFFVCSRPNSDTTGKNQPARTKVQSTQYTFHNTTIPSSPSSSSRAATPTVVQPSIQDQAQLSTVQHTTQNHHNRGNSQDVNSPTQSPHHPQNHHHSHQQHSQNSQQRIAYIQQQQQPQQQKEQQYYIQQQNQHAKMKQEQHRMQQEEAFFRSIANEPSTNLNSPKTNFSTNTQQYPTNQNDETKNQDQMTIVVNKQPQLDVQIYEMHPASGPLDGGQVVTLLGEFSSLIALSPVDLQIYFGLIPATKIDIIDSARIVCITPPRFIPGTVKVVCVLNGRELPSTLSFIYTSQSGDTKSQVLHEGLSHDHHRHRHYHLHHHHHPYYHRTNSNQHGSSGNNRTSPTHTSYGNSSGKQGVSSFVSTYSLPPIPRHFPNSGQNNSFSNSNGQT